MFAPGDRKSTRLNSSHANISYAVFCLKKKKGGATDLLALKHFFFNDTATTEIYTLSLHDALPILPRKRKVRNEPIVCHNDLPIPMGETALRRSATYPTFGPSKPAFRGVLRDVCARRSEEHTSELQSRQYLVCRLLLEKKERRSYRFVGSEAFFF